MLLAVSCFLWLAASASSVGRVRCRSSTSATAMCLAPLRQSAAADEVSSAVLGPGDKLACGFRRKHRREIMQHLQRRGAAKPLNGAECRVDFCRV